MRPPCTLEQLSMTCVNMTFINEEIAKNAMIRTNQLQIFKGINRQNRCSVADPFGQLGALFLTFIRHTRSSWIRH